MMAPSPMDRVAAASAAVVKAKQVEAHRERAMRDAVQARDAARQSRQNAERELVEALDAAAQVVNDY